MFELKDLVNEFAKLPGIGKKSASRISTFLLKNKKNGFRLSEMIQHVIDNVIQCPVCGNFTIKSPCSICEDKTRDPSIICIVEDTGDLQAIEESGCYRGYYHILMGTINPLDGIGPEHLRIPKLLERLKNSNFREILIATNPTIEGDATFLYLQNLLLCKNYKISRIATGIPMGGSLEYADKLTINKALQSKIYLS